MDISSFFKNKVVLVTGSSMGIGKELAKLVLVNGGKVVLTSRDASRLEATKKELRKFSSSILVYPADVSNFEMNQVLIKKTLERFGKLDVLITNAGLSCYGEVEMLKPGVARQVIDTNIYGTLFPIMASIPALRESGGSILLISSIAGLYGLPGYSTYSLSKMSLTALAQSLKLELKTSNIFVGIAYLGFTENDNDKKTINPNGELETVPERPKQFTSSKEETSIKILKQISNRKHSVTHTLFGKVTNIISRYFPFLLDTILLKNFKNRKFNELF